MLSTSLPYNMPIEHHSLEGEDLSPDKARGAALQGATPQEDPPADDLPADALPIRETTDSLPIGSATGDPPGEAHDKLEGSEIDRPDHQQLPARELEQAHGPRSDDFLTVDQVLHRYGFAYWIEITGDSMEGADLVLGDWVLVVPGPPYRSGE